MRRAFILAAAFLTACNTYEPVSLHGAASMRVEVEVYKGPLTSPFQGQVGELVGVLSNEVRALHSWRKEAERLRDAKRCRESNSASCQMLSESIGTANSILSASCYAISSPAVRDTVSKATYLPIFTCRDIVGAERSSSVDERKATSREATKESSISYGWATLASMEAQELLTRECLTAAKRLIDQVKCNADLVGMMFDNISSMLSGAARRTSDSAVRRIPDDPDIRSLLVEYASMTAEYGEQIHARVTLIQKLLPEDIVDVSGKVGSGDVRTPNTLPVSDYLRSTSRTDYIQLYDWLQGAEEYPNDRDKLNPAERIRMAQRLTADNYWQKVNEVYASGQGDVAMAFIKDDLGNWDLKSFSNDPAELLASYRRVTDAALKTAVDLTRRVATGPAGEAAARIGTAQKAASLANQFATGDVPATPGVVGGVNVAALHDRAAERIAAQKTRFEALERRLTKERDDQKTAFDTAEGKRAVAESELASRKNLLTTKRGEREERAVDLADAKAKLRDQQAAGGSTTTEQTAVDTAQRRYNEAQLATETAETDLLKVQLALDGQVTAKNDAQAKLKAAEARLADLPKEAIEAVRGTLDDHLAVVAALQDGIASASTPQGQGRRPPGGGSPSQ